MTRSLSLAYIAVTILSSQWIRGVMAGYMSVSMTQAVQCGTSIVSWSGDSGPYHLLLTPTTFVEHGYNVWVDSIPNGTTSYNLAIKQPAGLQYMVTVWGASGISYAATTDVLTVAASSTGDSSCFLSDTAILNLYDFSFNITGDNDDYPPQCSNLTMSWPTSLESNVTSDVTRRDEEMSLSEFNEFYDADDIDLNVLDTSSSDKHSGNTTYPPSMFGIIPLGNSFSIPITYSTKSKYAKYLPNSSLSDTPTTHTSQGVTYLDWTVDLSKGTRFILVAGIGSAQEWASGGSSVMMTVGQGSTGCVGSEQSGGGAPSVTASGTSTGVSTGQASNQSGGHSGPNPVVRTVVACVCSVVGTLVIVGLIFLLRRTRRRRRESEARGEPYTGGFVGLFKKAKPAPAAKAVDTDDGVSANTPLDLVASRNAASHRDLAPLVVNTDRRSPGPSPIDGLDPFRDSHSKEPFLSGPSRSGTLDGFGTGTISSPLSPIRGRDDLRATLMTRGSSQDALLSAGSNGQMIPHVESPTDYGPGYSAGSGTGTGTFSGFGTGTYLSSARGPLMLHNVSGRDELLDDNEQGEAEDVPDLKRDTIAYLGSRQGTSAASAAAALRSGAPSVASAPPNRRRRGPPRTGDQEMEYMVHRDAGRVVPNAESGGNVLELPPRYEELAWTEEERRDREREEQERQTR